MTQDDSIAREFMVIHRPRKPLWHPHGFLQMIAALWFSSYFFFWIVDLLAIIALVYCGILSRLAAVSIVAAYLGSIVVYRPQNNKGWHFGWFLYSGFVDLVLGYYNATAIREGPPLDPKGRYLFAMSPHGIFGVCRGFSGGSLWTSFYPGIAPRWGSFGGAFFIPGVREFSLCCGCLDASRPVLERAIKRGESVVLIPGGTKELLLTDGSSTETALVLTDRKGFVKLAIKNGMQLVPGFCFGEKWIHDPVLLPAPLRAVLYKRFKLAGTVLKGRWWTFLGKTTKPDGSDISLGYVWGAAIPVRQEMSCSDEYVDEVHRAYMRAVSELFERHKARFGYSAEETLKFVSASG